MKFRHDVIIYSPLCHSKLSDFLSSEEHKKILQWKQIHAMKVKGFKTTLDPSDFYCMDKNFY